MSKSLLPRPDVCNAAEPTVKIPPQDAAAPQGVEQSRPVRELPPPPKSSQAQQPPQIDAEPSPRPWWRSLWPRGMSAGCTASFLFHLFLMVALALVVESALVEGRSGDLSAWFNVPVPLDSRSADLRPEAIILPPSRLDGDAPELDHRVEMPAVSELTDKPDRRDNRPVTPFGFQPAEPTDWLMPADAPPGGGLEGRSPGRRAALAESGGGNPRSEAAVERGLRWLMAVQLDNGSWNFDHRKSNFGRYCKDPGSASSTTAATAITLLPFLGAGYTHKEGQYRKVVRRGLYYLGTRALTTPHGLDLQDGTMYGQGLAAIALGEAYAMTGDKTLRAPAQGAVDFIVYAQDTKRGGWRYTPGEPGDTTVTGWQLMGLQSGRMARLDVPLPAIYLTRRFLDSVQYEDGSQYGYMDRRPRKTTTAVGLLMRMYTGWRRNHPGLQRGVVYLSNWGPSQENIYFDYYATQVMHHWGGAMWERWNAEMRDYLVAAQADSDYEAGSWFFPRDRGGQEGGRLYSTAMAVMTLEVYYRYMPLYGAQSTGGNFPE